MVTGTVANGTTTPVRWDVRQWSLLFVLSGNMLLDAVEVSVVLIALPTIAGRLGLTPFGVQWLMSGFALGFAALLLLGPSLSARLGRRRTYVGAMLLFSLASLAGGLVEGLAFLVVIRVVKGCCAALTAPAGLAIINDIFPDGPQRRRALSVYSFFGAAGFTTGLLLAGLLLEADWRWIFVFPAPVALVLLLYGAHVLPRERARSRARLPRLALLRDNSLLRSALGAASLNGTYQSLLVLMIFQAHEEFGWAPWRTALALLPACVPLALTVPFAGRLVARYGSRRLITLGALFPLLGYGLYLAKPEGSPYALGMLPALLLVEAGFCCAFAALNMQATASFEAADRGAAVALYQTCVQLGAGVLLPLVVLLLTRTDGLRPALALITAAGALGLVASLTGRSASRGGRAQHVDHVPVSSPPHGGFQKMADQSPELSVNPGPIMGLVFGYWQSRILLAAVEHEVFTELSERPATSAELADRLGLAPLGTNDLLVGLSHLGLLHSEDGKFTNSAVADRFLVRGRPEHLGGYLRFCEQELNPAWDGLATSLRTGKPQNRAAVAGNPYDTLYADADATGGFLDSMDLLSTPIGLALSRFDWSGYSSFVDIGGARGHFAHQVVSQNPHLTGAVFDLPPLESAFKRYMDELGGPASSISFHGGDFFTDKLPEADVLVLGHVLHNWSAEDRVRLLKKAYESVKPGGAVFVYDPMAGGEEPSMHAALAGLTMLVWSRGGHEYSVGELHGWLREAGFAPETAEVADLHDDVLVIGHKNR